MKRDIKQTSDIRGLEFFNTIDNNYKFDTKKLNYLESISTSLFKINPEALKLFKEDYTKNNILPIDISPQEFNYLNKIPKSEFFSYLVYRYEFKVFPKKKIRSAFPCYVLIEPVSSCNLKCPMCFQSDKTFIKKEYMGKMQPELFKKVVDECEAGGTKAITFGSRGEPTIHPDFLDFVSYVKGKFMDVKIITNATKLNEKLIHKIFSSNISQVVFSIDSENKEEYEELRKFAKYDEVLNNVKLYNEIKRTYKDVKTVTRISGVKVRKSQDPDSFNSFWSKYADEVVMKPAYPRWNTYLNDPEPNFIKPCSYLWERMYIWFDGKVNPCDADYKSNLSYGNISDNTIKEVWNSSKLLDYREKHISGKRSNFMPCDRCSIA